MNEFTIMGTIAADPEHKTYKTFAVTTARIMTLEKDWKGNQVEMEHVIKDESDLLSDYKAGDLVQVSGSFSSRPWTNPQGEVKYFTNLVIDTIQRVEEGKRVVDNTILEDIPF